MLGRRFGLAALGGLSIVFLAGRVDAPLRIEIVDAATGLPLAATVFLADETGKPLAPAGQHSKVEYLGRMRYYVDGGFSLAAPPRRLTVDVRRGFETLPGAQTFAVDAGTRRLTVRLRRFIDMGRLGYASGDTHVHYLSLVDSHLQMRAEDMPVLNLLTSDFTHDAEKFTGHLDPVSTNESSVYVGQELRDWQHGHVIFMDLRRLVEPLGPAGGDFMGESHPHRLLVPALREARRQNAVTSWAHFENLPGIESAIDISLGLIDAVDLITYNDPTGLPAHWAPWKESGFSQAEFTVMRGLDLYYQYLNAGFRLPIGAGSDKMGDDIPVGCNRFYGRLAGGSGYAGWVAALKAGRGFITNQPLLFLTVDGHEPGDVIPFTGRRRVTARAEAQSLLPFVNLEIVVNGTEVATRTTYPWQARAEGGIYRARAEVTLELGESSWIAARVGNDPDIRPMPLPRNLGVFAHTNPVYFDRDGRGVSIEASRLYLMKYVDGATHWFEKRARFATESERTEALAAAAEARRVLASPRLRALGSAPTPHQSSAARRQADRRPG